MVVGFLDKVFERGGARVGDKVNGADGLAVVVVRAVEVGFVVDDEVFDVAPS